MTNLPRMESAVDSPTRGDHGLVGVLLDPSNFASVLDAGVKAETAGQLRLARWCYSRGAILRPSEPVSYFNLGNVLVSLGQFKAASAAFERSIAFGLNTVDAALNSALCNLLIENYDVGWLRYLRRWELPSGRLGEFGPTGYLSLPAFNPKDGESEHLLIWGEQGLGDQIMFASMLPEALALAKRVTVAVDHRLVHIFTRSFPSLTARPMTDDSIEEGFDRQIPMGNLGFFFRRSLDNFPTQPQAFLTSDSSRRKNFSDWLAAQNVGPVVGVSWKSTNWATGESRSIPLRSLLRVAVECGLTPVCLQYGDPSAVKHDIELAYRETGIRLLEVPELDLSADLEGVAALISACDRVVSAGNTVGHFSGALGQETHLLLPKPGVRNERAQVIPNWRWGVGVPKSRWYQNVSLYRQQSPGDWDAPIAEMIVALTSRLRSEHAL